MTQAAVELTASYRAELEALAAWCDEQGLATEAARTRAWFGARAPNKLYVAVLVEKIGSLNTPADASGTLATWHDRFAALRRKQGQALHELARRAVRVRRASLGLELVLAAVREDPDHSAARRLLGFQPHGGHWRTLYEIRQLHAGRAWHDRFGWLPRGHVERYERGERYYRGRWISAEEDTRLHADIRQGWEIETEHYTIRTNHGIESGVELGVKLEQLYRVWRQLFFRYFATEAQLASLFEGRTRSRPANLSRHAVAYFRDRQNYNDSLRPALPNIDVSVGVYIDTMRRAYFFAGEGRDERTLLHEATHQLFHESRPVSPELARHANYWIVEGIAMYMETLRQENGYHVLGGFDDARMHAARYRLIEDDFYVPLAEFSSYGIGQVQQDPRIATLYSQAAGLTHFLIHHDAGKYRDQLVAYLAAVYSGQANVDTLSTLTGMSYTELDRQYRRFMESTAQKSP